MKTPNTSLLSIEEVMNGYAAVSSLYPYTPSMTIWRAWELAAYRRYALLEPILDLGCGDGQYFRLVWPSIKNVTGVDIDIVSSIAAERSGVYSSVSTASALDMKFPKGSFASVFANCSLEHMDDIDLVLAKVRDVLIPHGHFLLSVTTDKFLTWGLLPKIFGIVSGPQKEQQLLDQYKQYHHLVTAIPPAEWIRHLEAAGFEVLEHIPIVPEVLGRVNLLLDNLWHVQHGKAELGLPMENFFRSLNNFPEEFGKIIRSLLEIEKNWTVGSGAVFYAKKCKE